MNSKKFDLVAGRNPIEEYLRHAPGRIQRVHINLDKNSPYCRELVEELKKKKIAFQFSDKTYLDKISQGARHQGVAAEVEPKQIYKLKDYADKLQALPKSLFLMIDSISDPHNVGAIIRAAECFGADGLIYSPNRGADLTPVVYKSSAGAAQFLNLYRENNLNQAISEMKKLGFWVVGCDCTDESKQIGDFKFPDKTLIILGSEGAGIQRILRENCDHLVNIQMYGKVDSLNVSQAAAVFCAFYRNG